MHKYLFNFFRDNNVITAFQSGFVPGDSTVNQLIDIYNTRCKAFDEGKEIPSDYLLLISLLENMLTL